MAGHAGTSRGFTLIEVLVALFVFAIAMTALVQAGMHRAENLGYLRDRTLANWIAENRMSRLRLEPGTVSTGRRDGEVAMADRRWHWETQVLATDDDTVRRVEIAVREVDDEEPVSTLTGYLAIDDIRSGTPSTMAEPEAS